MKEVKEKVRATCSECGSEIVLSDSIFTLRDYTYQVGLGDKVAYQCGYTCYHHADLRLTKPPMLQTKEQRVKEVESCERSMIGQGKKILHPIKVK